MVFDGKHLTPFDTQLIDQLNAAQGALEPDVGEAGGGGGPRGRRDRRVAAVAMGCFVVMALVLGGLAVRSRNPGSDDGRDTRRLPSPGLDHGEAEQQVLAALATTTATGRFDVSYRFSEALGEPTTTTTTGCRDTMRSPVIVVPSADGSGSLSASGTDSAYSTYCMSSGRQAVSVTGSGTVSVSPKVMVVSADISGGLQVSVRVAGDQVWESGGAGYGMAASGSDGPGQPLSGFANLVEGTLGPREGALAMTRMASPNAYLSIEQSTVDGARIAGTGTVDGIPVTDYEVAIDLDQLRRMDGLTADERTTIDDALGGLHDQGYSGTLDTISVDAQGLIRRVVSVSSFDDGGSVTYDATYTNFACDGSAGEPSATVGVNDCPAATTTSTTTAVPPSSSVTPTSEDPASTTTTGASASTTSRPTDPTTTGA